MGGTSLLPRSLARALARRAPRHRVWAIALGLILTGSLALARAPDQPLRFDPDPIGKDPWTLRLFIEPEAVRNLRLERQIFRAGEQIRAERIRIEPRPMTEQGPEAARVLVAPLPLRIEAMRALEPGAYAQRIVVEGDPVGRPDARPVHIEQWVHFLVERGTIRRLSLEEYSAIADPSEIVVAPDGREMTVQPGVAERAEVPLPQTNRRAAVPLGQSGGLAPERGQRSEGAAARDAPAEDLSEIDED